MTRLSGSPSFNDRVTLLAWPTFLHINTLARPFGSTRSRRDDQCMREHCSHWKATKAKGSTFYKWLHKWSLKLTRLGGLRSCPRQLSQDRRGPSQSNLTAYNFSAKLLNESNNPLWNFCNVATLQSGEVAIRSLLRDKNTTSVIRDGSWVKNPTTTATWPDTDENDNRLRYSYKLKYFIIWQTHS